MRLFLAIELPPDLRHHIWTAAEPLRDAMRESAATVRWVREPQLHLTLKFFGETPPDRIGAMGASIQELAARHRQPVVRLAGIGAFPNLRRPTVVWVGVEPDARLELLHHDIEVSSSALGVEIEGRPFRPHLTIGRIGGATRKGSAASDPTVRSLARVARRVRAEGEFTVPSIDLMQSTRDASGSIYTTVLTAPLRRD